MKPGWYICNGEHTYVPRAWKKEKDARLELALLLRPYPPDSIWRKKLVVRWRGKTLEEPTTNP